MLAMPRFDDGAIDMRELLRRLAERAVNAIMDAGTDRLCGGGANSRNGYHERSLATCVGTLTSLIPKLHSGSFFPEGVLGRHRRVGRTLVATVAEMHATGTGTRKVQRVAEKMGVSRLSKDQVSAIASSLDADIEDLFGRPLDGSPVPCVRLDATYVKYRREGRVTFTAVVTAIGCDAGGWGRVLGVDVVDTESYDSWPAFLAIRSRGAAGVGSSSRTPAGARPGARRGLPGRRVAVPCGPPHARLRTRGRLLAAQAPRGQNRVAGVPRARRRRRDGHVPRNARHAGGVLPEGGWLKTGCPTWVFTC